MWRISGRTEPSPPYQVLLPLPKGFLVSRSALAAIPPSPRLPPTPPTSPRLRRPRMLRRTRWRTCRRILRRIGPSPPYRALPPFGGNHGRPRRDRSYLSKNPKSKINNQQSTINNLFLFGSSLAENQGRPQRDRPYHNHTDPIP